MFLWIEFVKSLLKTNNIYVGQNFHFIDQRCKNDSEMTNNAYLKMFYGPKKIVSKSYLKTTILWTCFMDWNAHILIEKQNLSISKYPITNSAALLFMNIVVYQRTRMLRGNDQINQGVK